MAPSRGNPMHSVENDLIKAVLYPFALCDYEGTTAITLKSVSSSDLFEEIHIDVINKALDVSQRAELIDWDEDKIGGIRLTKTGLARFMQVRDEFFDADALRLLKESLEEIDAVHEAAPTTTVPRAKASDPCPRSGVWQPLGAMAGQKRYRAGEIMHDLRLSSGLTVWSWVRE